MARQFNPGQIKTGSLFNISSSYALTASLGLNAVSSSFATTASYLNTLNQALTFNGNLTLNGTASISYLNVSYETASVIYSSGSNQFGDAANDTQTLYGNVIIPTGSVGIGTTSPTVALQVGDTTSTGNYIRVLGTGSATDTTYDVFVGARRYPRITLQDTTVGGATFQMWNLGSQMRIGTNAGNQENCAWFTKVGDAADVIFNGNVGIGTTTPNAKLDVLGSARITNGLTVTGSLNVTGGQTVTLNGKLIQTGSHAEGQDTNATGNYSHAEGVSTTTIGYASHAEGFNTNANGSYSHAEGSSTTATGQYSHAEGYQTTATGYHSHAEGNTTTATGEGSHAEGSSTVANGQYSHAEGLGTIAQGAYQHVQGQFNLASSAQSAFIVGNGIDVNNRSNLIFASGSTVQVTGSLMINDILQLSRRTTTPIAVEGMIIASGSAGASKVYYYNGAEWNALF